VRTEEAERLDTYFRSLLRVVLEEFGEGLLDALTPFNGLSILVNDLTVRSKQVCDSLGILGVIGLDECSHVGTDGFFIGGAVRLRPFLCLCSRSRSILLQSWLNL